MTQDHATPVSRRTLTIVRAGTEVGSVPVPPVLDAGTGPGTEPVPVPPVPVPMPVLKRARLAVSRHAGTAARTAGEIWAPCGRTLYRLWHPEPESMAGHRAYIQSRAWVPPELTGKPAAVIAWAGIAYHILIGHPVKSAMKAVVKAAMNIDRDAERPLRLLMLAAFVSAIVLILSNP